jgi:hypothetical protein
MSTSSDLTGPTPGPTPGSAPEAPPQPAWHPPPALDRVTRLAGVAFLVGGLFLTFCAGDLVYNDNRFDTGWTNIGEFINDIGAAIGLSIVAGVIAMIGGAKVWSYAAVVGAMGFVVLDFTYVTRFFAWSLANDYPDVDSTAAVLALTAWLLFLVALAALTLGVLATRTWRRPLPAPFALWLVALGAVVYTLWQHFGAWGQSGFERQMPLWWSVVAVAGVAVVLVLLALAGMHPMRAVRVATPAILGSLMLATLLIGEIWEYWQWLFRDSSTWGYPTTIVASLVAAVLYAVSRTPDAQTRKG